MNKLKIFLLAIVLTSCSSGDRYDPSKYFNQEEQKDVLTNIITYIFSAPPYTSMQDRFKPEHRDYYRSVVPHFVLDELFIDEKGKHYYFVLRPGPNESVKRGAGGYFDMSDDKTITNFREAFVTPILEDSTARARGRFLFAKMVEGKLEPYLKMGSYTQWPNAASYYDSTTYEWKLSVGENPDESPVNPN